MLETVEFIVKDKSVNNFFMKYHSRFKTDSKNSRIDDINPYYLFEDEIILDRSLQNDIAGNKIGFELFDITRASNKSVTNQYLYEIVDYDSVSVKLVLIDFKITVGKL